MKGQITENFRWEEFELSRRAIELRIDNTIPDTEAVKMPIRALCVNLLQPLRNTVGLPLHINSGYRCPALNKAVGGVPSSQHCKGEAADIAAADPLLLAQVVLHHRLPFDQMILYSDFVHLSYRHDVKNRKQVLYDKSYKLNYPKDETR